VSTADAGVQQPRRTSPTSCDRQSPLICANDLYRPFALNGKEKVRYTPEQACRIRQFGVAQPGESPHELHIASTPPAARTPVMNMDGDAGSHLRPRGGRTVMPVLLIAEPDLPEDAYAEIADKVTPLLR